MMVLDTANTRTYVDGRNEITYLPRQIEIVARYGTLCMELAQEVQVEAEQIENRCRGPYGQAYDAASTAGRAVRLLLPETTLQAIPTEDTFRAAGAWGNAKRDELAELDVALALRPATQAAVVRRMEGVFTTLRRELVTPELRDGIMAEIRELDLDGVPLRFEEETDRGRNYFAVSLDTPRAVSKSRVLSEGEQRALGIACFFAEMKRIRGKHSIIVDDPVSCHRHDAVTAGAGAPSYPSGANRRSAGSRRPRYRYFRNASAAAAGDRLRLNGATKRPFLSIR